MRKGREKKGREKERKQRPISALLLHYSIWKHRTIGHIKYIEETYIKRIRTKVLPGCIYILNFAGEVIYLQSKSLKDRWSIKDQ